jgi:hypothetical protein
LPFVLHEQPPGDNATAAKRLPLFPRRGKKPNEGESEGQPAELVPPQISAGNHPLLKPADCLTCCEAVHHTLRKNRESDWIRAGFPFHVVVEWMGHSDEVARQHYLGINASDIAAASQTQIPEKLTQKVT